MNWPNSLKIVNVRSQTSCTNVETSIHPPTKIREQSLQWAVFSSITLYSGRLRTTAWTTSGSTLDQRFRKLLFWSNLGWTTKSIKINVEAGNHLRRSMMCIKIPCYIIQRLSSLYHWFLFLSSTHLMAATTRVCLGKKCIVVFTKLTLYLFSESTNHRPMDFGYSFHKQ